MAGGEGRLLEVVGLRFAPERGSTDGKSLEEEACPRQLTSRHYPAFQ